MTCQIFKCMSLLQIRKWKKCLHTNQGNNFTTGIISITVSLCQCIKAFVTGPESKGVNSMKVILWRPWQTCSSQSLAVNWWIRSLPLSSIYSRTILKIKPFAGNTSCVRDKIIQPARSDNTELTTERLDHLIHLSGYSAQKKYSTRACDKCLDLGSLRVRLISNTYSNVTFTSFFLD